MIFIHRLLSFGYLLALRWQESGENPAVFCYLIGWGTFARHFRDLAPIPGTVRRDAACSNPSFTFSAPCSIPSNFEN